MLIAQVLQQQKSKSSKKHW